MNSDLNQDHPEQNDVERIRAVGQMIRQKRVTERLTLEMAATQSGVSAATLSRLERQAEMKTKNPKGFITPDTRTITSLVRWLGTSLGEIINDNDTRSDSLGARILEGGTTPEIVEAYLRADRNLSPEAAGMLAEMFRLAYRQYSHLSTTQSTANPPSTASTEGANE